MPAKIDSLVPAEYFVQSGLQPLFAVQDLLIAAQEIGQASDVPISMQLLSVVERELITGCAASLALTSKH